MAKRQLTPISGSDMERAPAPKRGMLRAVYDTVEALGGGTVANIKEYLPAAITESSQVVTKKKLEKYLYAAVYNGYLITQGGYYRIAPKSYYEARQKIIKEQKDRVVSKKPGEDAPPHEFIVYRPLWHWALIISVGVAAFSSGMMIGAMVGMVVS